MSDETKTQKAFKLFCSNLGRSSDPPTSGIMVYTEQRELAHNTSQQCINIREHLMTTISKQESPGHLLLEDDLGLVLAVG